MSTAEGEFERLLAVPKSERTLGGARDEAWFRACEKLMDDVQRLPYRGDYRYAEPSDLESIQRARPAAPRLARWRGSKRELLERLHGGLLGRICGCMLGKPVEGWHRRSIRITGAATGNWPLGNYLRLPTKKEDAAIAAQKPTHRLHRWWTAIVRDGMNGMVEDDDTNYTTVGFAVVQKHGKDFTPLDMASFWGQELPIFHTCTAERVAYRNFANGVLPPLSGSYRNPYREWIGAQIRADYFGYANPGNPERAAAWAWRDACVSHVKNGIYGELWVAATLAAAYVEADWITIIRAGLAQVPQSCRLREDVEKIIGAFMRGSSYESTVDMIHTQWDETRGHDWCHTNSNAQIVTAALLFGDDDYEKTITRAVMPGFDTDCNGATAGSLWGVRHGVKALPRKWTRPMRDHIRTGVASYANVTISKLAADMAETALKNSE
ncbi:MAG: ADP-ribosylglycohydrolase family protein [Planctomycetota bacterium]|nr:ADP-ribosylglycohydrolase family protein [Planctomycetota bacterium]